MIEHDSHVTMRIKLPPEIGKWHVSKPIENRARLEAQYSLRADGSLIRRDRTPGDHWNAYEYFSTAGWTINDTIEFLNSLYPDVTRL